MSMEPDLSRLPLAVTSFAEMVRQSKIYVDKTDLVGRIARSEGPVFLSRPRRFGKSTLVNTFHELFAHGLSSFKGLKIETQHIWDDPLTYQVLHLDFSLIKEKRDDLTFPQMLRTVIKNAFAGCHYEFREEDDVVGDFAAALLSFPNRSLVLLVDEYDSPLAQVMQYAEEFENRRALLSAFFLTVKSYAAKFRFIFITGVTRISDVSIFSAFNNVEDISFNSQYGAITGYTQTELESCFREYIVHAAKIMNQELNTTEYDYARVLLELKDHYDGYCFDSKHRFQVYNPWSILNFLKNPGEGFLSYWLQTGGAAPALLVNFLNDDGQREPHESRNGLFQDLDATYTVAIRELSPVFRDIKEQDYPLTAILYQAGYLTIKKVFRSLVEIGIPNLEVKQAFAEIILRSLTAKDGISLLKKYWEAVDQALKQQNYTQLKAIFNQYLNEFSPEAFLNFNEAAFRDVIKSFLILMGYNAYSEYPTATGYSDLCLSLGQTLFVFEFKLTDKREKAQAGFETAAEQLRSYAYGVRLTEQKVVTLAAVIVCEKALKQGATPLRELNLMEPIDSV